MNGKLKAGEPPCADPGAQWRGWRRLHAGWDPPPHCNTMTEEFHETLPPDWVPPEYIRAWDAATPERRRVMKAEVERRRH